MWRPCSLNAPYGAPCSLTRDKLIALVQGQAFVLMHLMALRAFRRETPAQPVARVPRVLMHLMVLLRAF